MNIKLLSILLLLGSAGANELGAQEKGPRGQRFQQGAAQKQGQQGQQRPDREAKRQQILERFDLDGDGKLNQQEREALRAARGKHSQNGERAQRPTREQMIQRFDTDGDGKLNETERQAMRQVAQQRRGSRGRAGEQGQRAPRGRRGQQQGELGEKNLQRGERLQKRIGQQGDREQRRAQMMQAFDANQDGQLDEFERQALREAIKKRRAAHRQSQGQGLNPEAKQGRARQGRGSADAPQSGLRPRQR